MSLIVIEPVIRVDKKYWPGALLKKCKYEIKKTKMENLINDDLDSSSSDETDSEFDNGSDSDESND